MDFYQGVVMDYLRADRAVFVNPQCCIQLKDQPNPDTSGPHWYCDAVPLDLRNKAVFLSEISVAAKLGGLIEYLKQWTLHEYTGESSHKRYCAVLDECRDFR